MSDQLELDMTFDESVSSNVADCRPPGIYRDVPFEEYAGWRAINSGVAKWGHVSMSHMLAAYEGRLKSEDTKDRKLGRAIHQRILEPDRPLTIASSCCAPVKSRNNETCGKSGRYISEEPLHIEDQFRQAETCLLNAGFRLDQVSESGSRYYGRATQRVRVSDHDANEKTTNWLADVSGFDIRVGGRMAVFHQIKAAIGAEPAVPLKFWYCGTHKPDGAVEPLDYVSDDEASRIERCVESLKKMPASPLLRQHGWSEVSIVWVFEGMLLKGRLDRYAEGTPGVVLDLKKMQVGKGSKEDCKNAVVKNGYHRQAAIYAKGIQFHTGHLPAVVWVFQEDNEPFEPQILMATPEEIEMAWTEVAERLLTFKDCRQRGVFPGYYSLDREGQILGEPGALPVWWHLQRIEMERRA